MSAKTASPAVIDLVKGRDETGLCEIGTKCGGADLAVQTAHRRGKQNGGVGKKNVSTNTASNLLRGCLRCHSDIDNGRVKNAESLGLKVRGGVAHPSEIPVKHVRFGWILLDDRGGYRPAPARACRPGDLWPVVAVGPWDLLIGAGAAAEALSRFGHGDCAGWPGVSDGLLVCGCGTPVFVADEVAS